MDDFNTRNLLSKLPPREPSLDKRAELRGPSASFTAVEAFARDVVENVEGIGAVAEADVLDVMQQLATARVSSPISIRDLKAVVLPPALKREKRIYARLLRALNGDIIPLVTPRQIFLAASRERVIAATEMGWDSSEAITTYAAYTCRLLLQSVGVSADVLPPAKSVPSAIKSRIDGAWKIACIRHAWKDTTSVA